MLFLNLVDTYIITPLISGAGEIVGSVINGFWLNLCQTVYPLLSWLFSVFTRLYSVDILSEGIIHEIYGRITIIITIIMVFYITFEFVKYTVSPDTITDKEKGAVPLFVRIILVIIMLAFVPTIFSVAKDLQQRVLNSNVIPRVILGTEYSDTEISGVGREFVGDVFSAFIRVDCDNVTLFSTCEGAKKSVEESIEMVKSSGLFLKARFAQFSTLVEFNGFLALIFGCFMLYVIFLYCKDVALRHIQLLYLQIIAPIAIMSYIAPKKDGMFKKWLKQCTTTYLDLFIRVAVLYFIILVCGILGNTFSIDELKYAGDQGQISITIYLFLIAGLLMFLKKAPKLLEELFPKSGAASISFGFSTKERQGILGGGISNLGKNILKNAEPIARAYGAIRGGVEGYKGFNTTKENDPLGEKYKDQSKWRRRIDRLRVAGKAAMKGFDAGQKGFSAVSGVGQNVAYEASKVVVEGGDIPGYFAPYASQKYKDEQQIEIDSKDRQIKFNKSKSTMYETIKSAQDKAEDRSLNKLKTGEQKYIISSPTDAQNLVTKILGGKANKYGIEIIPGETTSDNYLKIMAKATSSKNTAASFTQEFIKATAEGDTEKAERLKALADEKSIEAQELEKLAGDAAKALQRYAITRELRGDVEDKEKDGALHDIIDTVKQNMRNVRAFIRSNPDIEEELKQELDAKTFGELMNCDNEVKEFGTLDDIQGALTSLVSKLNNQNSILEEEKRQIQDSDKFRAATANTSGKK